MIFSFSVVIITGGHTLFLSSVEAFVN